VGDSIEIEPSSWKVDAVSQQPNDFVEKDAQGNNYPENKLVKINPEMTSVKNTVSLTRKVVPGDLVKVFLNPSMTLIEAGTIYL
jgi:hypothetical protein